MGLSQKHNNSNNKQKLKAGCWRDGSEARRACCTILKTGVQVLGPTQKAKYITNSCYFSSKGSTALLWPQQKPSYTQSAYTLASMHMRINNIEAPQKLRIDLPYVLPGYITKRIKVAMQYRHLHTHADYGTIHNN